MSLTRIALLSIVTLALGAGSAAAQGPAGASASNGKPAPAGVALPQGYVIGPGDVLTVVIWREKDMSGDVTVRPDGKITLPLLNEIDTAGLTPEQLRVKLVEAAAKFVEDPDVTVVVREIRSRVVFITGNVAKPANYLLNTEMTVLQLIAVAGGVLEYAKSKDIKVIRTENGRTEYFKFNYNDVIKQKGTAQNIVLKPGDTVVVP